MNSRVSVRRYTGQRVFRVKLADISRDLPLVRINPELYIASNAELILGDVEFLSAAARVLAGKIDARSVDMILTAEAKSIALAYELSRLLGLGRFIVARKSAKAYVGNYISQRVKSITTDSEQQLLLTKDEMAFLSGKKVCLLDDVVSTGATIEALEDITRRAGGSVVCRAAIWKEGPWYKDEVVCAGNLPVFVTKNSPLLKEMQS